MSTASSGDDAVARLDDRHHDLAPPLVGHAEHARVAHGRVRLQRLFDLLGEDLLAGGVDALRAAAEQQDRAVLRGPSPSHPGTE